MRERVENIVGELGTQHVDRHLPLPLRPHPPHRRLRHRPRSEFRHLRRRRSALLIREVFQSQEHRRQEHPAARCPQRDFQRQGKTQEPRGVRQRRDGFFERIASDVYKSYNALLSKANALDFDDILYYTNRLFSQRPDVLEKYQERFMHVLVDEYQDVNFAQYNIVHQIAASTKMSWSSATTTSRSTCGAVRTSRSSSVSAATIPTPRSSSLSATTALPRTILAAATKSSNATGAVRARSFGPTTRMACPSRSPRRARARRRDDGR
ncbi:DNA helicase [Sarracenia purpurea var. burkii]